MMLDNWQRIEKIVKWTGLSVNAFARTIGLNRSENLYQIKKGNNGISKELAELITKKYHNINKLWLLTGEGDNMFVNEDIHNAQSIPYYEMDVVRYILGPAEPKPKPSYYIALPVVGEIDFAAQSNEASMLPEIPPGASVALRECSVEHIVPGCNYLVVSPTFTGIRCIRREPGSLTLRLVPRNTEQYDEMVLNVDQIQRLYAVNAVIKS